MQPCSCSQRFCLAKAPLGSFWPSQTSRRVAWERKGDKVVAAPAEDLPLAKTYHAFEDKGQLVAGQWLTIMTHNARCRMRTGSCILHILEAVESGKRAYLVGPKIACDEYVDGKLVTPKGPGTAYCKRKGISLVLSPTN